MSHCGLDYPFPGLDLLLPHDQWEKLFPEFGGRGGPLAELHQHPGGAIGGSLESPGVRRGG